MKPATGEREAFRDLGEGLPPPHLRTQEPGPALVIIKL